MLATTVTVIFVTLMLATTVTVIFVTLRLATTVTVIFVALMGKLSDILLLDIHDIFHAWSK